MSIFDMNIDLFETYLLKVSGRALSATQHLNLNLTSAMVSHLKIFDTQHPEEPSEFEQELEAEVEIAKRREVRERRRRKKRRITASFNLAQEEEGQEEVMPAEKAAEENNQLVAQLEEDVDKRRRMLDSLNERDEREGQNTHMATIMEADEDGKLPAARDDLDSDTNNNPTSGHEEFDVNDRSQTIQLDPKLLAQHQYHPLLQIHDQEAPNEERKDDEGNFQQSFQQRPLGDGNTIGDTHNHPFVVTQEDPVPAQQTLRDFRASQLYPDSIIQTDEGGGRNPGSISAANQHNKIMIGDQSIDEHFGEDILLRNVDHHTHNEEEYDGGAYTLNEDDINRHHDDVDGENGTSNPFRRNKTQNNMREQQSIVVSQGSIPLGEQTVVMGQGFTMPAALELGMTNDSGQLLALPQKAKDDFDFKQSPSMPEIQPNEDRSAASSQRQRQKEALIDRIVDLGGSPRIQEEVVSSPIKQDIQVEPLSNHSPFESPAKEEPPILQSVATLQAQEFDLHIPQKVEEEPPLVLSQQLEEPIVAVQEDFRPTTAAAELEPAILIEEKKNSFIESAPPINHASIHQQRPELKEEMLQTSFDMKKPEEEPFSPSEPEVVMRFEVAVGTQSTPKENLSLEQQQHYDAAVGGSTPMNISIEEATQQLLMLQGQDMAVGNTQRTAQEPSLHHHSLANDDLQRLSNTSHPEPSPQPPQKPSRLEVTLTAEPDKPIMVEVRGGEKQFLISALTKHIYEILSQPHRMLANNQEGMGDQNEEGIEQEYDQEETLDQPFEMVADTQHARPIKIGKNINLKLKSLKKSVKGKQQQQDQENNSEQHAITIDHLDQSSKLLGEETILLPGAAHSQVRVVPSAHDQHHLQGIGKSSRSSSGIALSPLTNSVVVLDDAQRAQRLQNTAQTPSHHPQLAPPPQRRTERFQQHEGVRYDQISKRTTEEAEADARIREEVRLTQIFDSETAQSMLGQQHHVPTKATDTTSAMHQQFDASQRKNTTQQSLNRGESLVTGNHVSQSALLPMSQQEPVRPLRGSLQQQQVISDEVIVQLLPKSRPETANFNQQDMPQTQQMSQRPSLTELPPINMKSSQLSNRLLEIQQQQQLPRTPKQQQHMIMMHPSNRSTTNVQYEEEILYQEKQQKHSLRQRFSHTPDRASLQHHSLLEDPMMSGHHEYQPSPMTLGEEVEGQFSLPPLQPTIPMPHPNGYFGSDAGGEYMQPPQNYVIVSSSNNAMIAAQGEGNAENMMPQVNYYDPYMTNVNIATGNEYYQYSPNGYPEIIDSQIQEDLETTPEEYILAEGYLLHFKDQQHRQQAANMNGEIVERQVYDLSRNQPPVAQNSQKLQRQGTNSGYPPHYPNGKKNAGGAAPKLPAVNQGKKRVLGASNGFGNANNTSHNGSVYYGLNGGPAYRTLPYTPARSLSPLRRKNFVHYTANLQGAVDQHQQSTILPPQAQFQEGPHYYSQSPQPSRNLTRHSPYLSDDEFKILHDFYDIQCEPTGLHRGGVPLMRVKRINRPKGMGGGPFAPGQSTLGGAAARTYNIFNFNDEAQGSQTQNNTVVGGATGGGQGTVGLNKAISSLQIFYPQYQPTSPFKQEYLLSRTLATPSKWFDRFYQSTRNLNQTIQNLHKQHTRKLRSYSVTSLSSADATNGGVQGVRISSRENMVQPLFTKNQNTMGGGEEEIRDRGSMPVEGGRYQQTEMSTTHSSGKPFKKASASVKGASAIFMPPLHKIYAANMSHDQATAILQAAAERGQQHQKKNKQLPPRPGNNGNNGASMNSGSIFKQQHSMNHNGKEGNQQTEKKPTSGAAPVIIPPPILSAGSNPSGGGGNANTSISAAT